MSPVGGAAPKEDAETPVPSLHSRAGLEQSEGSEEPVRLTAADFQFDVTANGATVSPAGHQAVAEYEDEDAPERVEIHFAREICDPCPLRPRCPVRWRRHPELAGGLSLSEVISSMQSVPSCQVTVTVVHTLWG